MKNNNKKRVVLDTPNIIFFGTEVRKERIEENSLAILNLLSQDLEIIASVTPKMVKETPNFCDLFIRAIHLRQGQSVRTINRDPDEVVLQLADEQGLPILSNDKFKQEKYLKYKSRSRVIRFGIESYEIIPKNDYWKEYLYGGN